MVKSHQPRARTIAKMVNELIGRVKSDATKITSVPNNSQDRFLLRGKKKGVKKHQVEVMIGKRKRTISQEIKCKLV